MRELILPYVRNDFALVESYAYRPAEPLSTPVTAMVGDADPHVTAAQATGWGELTSGAFTINEFPGDHFYLVPQQAQVVSEILRQLNVPVS